MVFAHPGHELAVAGLMQRHRPHLLFLTRADGNNDTEREALARHGLDQLGLTGQTTFLSVHEADVYRCLLEGDVSPLLELRRRVHGWLVQVRPTTLFGDAFELTNVVHDIGRAVVDSAWREYREQTPCDNFELPLVCRTEPELWKLRFQEFPSGSFETVRLTQAEVDLKKSLTQWAGKQRPEAAMAEQYFSLGREVFRPVPADRDYSVPPEGLRFHYDDWGRFQVIRGKYAKPILFADHYVPLIRNLPH
jgi:hypothetical protein